MTTDDPRDPVDPTLPILPYAGTSGWSGSDTSRERAQADDASGTTAQRQADMIAHLDKAGANGLTYRELVDITGMHHGQVSGPLSNLHKAGEIARLKEVRHKCKVYVLPEYVGGRDTEQYKRNRKRLPGNANGPTTRIRDRVVEAEENRRQHVIVNTSDLRILLNLILDMYGDPE
jgi:hypothetical protein